MRWFYVSAGKKAASQVKAGLLKGQSFYQPSEADLAVAVTILVECGAVRIMKPFLLR